MLHFLSFEKKSEEEFTLRGVWKQGMEAKSMTLGVEALGPCLGSASHWPGDF